MKIITKAIENWFVVNSIDDLSNVGDIYIGADRQHYIVCQLNHSNVSGYTLYNIEDGLVVDTTHPDVFPLVKAPKGYQIILEQE